MLRDTGMDAEADAPGVTLGDGSTVSDEGNQLPSVEDAKMQQALESGKPTATDGASSSTLGFYGRLMCMVLWFVIVVVITASVVVAVVGGDNNSSKSLDKTSAGQFLVTEVYNGDEGVFLDAESPQARALKWMLEDNELNDRQPQAGTDSLFTAQQFVQRYAVTVFAYAVTPLSVRNDLGLLKGHVSECKCNAIYQDASIEDTALRFDQARTLGVLCDDDGFVSELRFPGMGLKGSLPLNELQLLTNLVSLELDGNDLTGRDAIPIIPSLTSLTLSHNALSGSLPSTIGDMSNLQFFSLAENDFESSLPDSVMDMKRLNVVALDGNRFRGVLPFLYELTDLREVYVGHNAINDKLQDDSFESCTNLEVLSMHNNKLHGKLPSAFFKKLLKLKHLNLYWNAIGGEEDWNNDDMLDYQGVLEYLNLHTNRMLGTLPRSLQFLSAHLTHLDVSDNWMDNKIPRTLEELTKLKVLMLERFGMGPAREFPEWLPKLKDTLEYLSFKNVNITGVVPTEIGELKQLKMLDLSMNKLTNQVPTELARLTDLRHLLLDQNEFTGKVPAGITSMPMLQSLMLNNNTITGDLGPAVDPEDAACAISTMTADCGAPLATCPDCSEDQEISCPCCSHCCQDVIEYFGGCAVPTWNTLKTKDKVFTEDVRRRRMLDGSTTPGYHYYDVQTRYVPLAT